MLENSGWIYGSLLEFERWLWSDRTPQGCAQILPSDQGEACCRTFS